MLFNSSGVEWYLKNKSKIFDLFRFVFENETKQKTKQNKTKHKTKRNTKQNKTNQKHMFCSVINTRLGEITIFVLKTNHLCVILCRKQSFYGKKDKKIFSDFDWQSQITHLPYDIVAIFLIIFVIYKVKSVQEKKFFFL